MLPELSPWLAMLNLLKSEALAGCGPEILRLGDVRPGDYEVFASLDNVIAKWRIEKAKSRNS